jgi:hypothetical protein
VILGAAGLDETGPGRRRAWQWQWPEPASVRGALAPALNSGSAAGDCQWAPACRSLASSKLGCFSAWQRGPDLGRPRSAGRPSLSPDQLLARPWALAISPTRSIVSQGHWPAGEVTQAGSTRASGLPVAVTVAARQAAPSRAASSAGILFRPPFARHSPGFNRGSCQHKVPSPPMATRTRSRGGPSGSMIT